MQFTVKKEQARVETAKSPDDDKKVNFLSFGKYTWK